MESLREFVLRWRRCLFRATGAAFLFVAGLAGRECGAAQDSLTITTNHYFVTGSTLREIRQSINRQRPGGEQAPADAVTHWKINWQTRLSSAGGELRVAAVTTSTTVTITMPSWRAPTNAAPPVVQQWVSYYSALQKHEWVHATNGIMAAAELRQRVGEIGPDSNSSRLQQRVQAVTDAVIEDYRKRDKDFDRETDHGRKAGARLP